MKKSNVLSWQIYCTETEPAIATPSLSLKQVSFISIEKPQMEELERQKCPQSGNKKTKVSFPPYHFRCPEQSNWKDWSKMTKGFCCRSKTWRSVNHLHHELLLLLNGLWLWEGTREQLSTRQSTRPSSRNQHHETTSTQRVVEANPASKSAIISVSFGVPFQVQVL